MKRFIFLVVCIVSFGESIGQAVPYLTFSGGKVWVKDLDEEVLHTFNRYNHKQSDWQEVFPVTMNGTDGKVLAGQYDVFKQSISFTPRFPFSRGVDYSASFRLNDLTENFNEIYLPRVNAEQLTLTFTVPVYQATEPSVVAVYPTASVIPENQLKFHITFNSPMTFGELYKRVKLFNRSGKQVDKAFLVLDQELWDEEMKTATLLLDPGRIKRGLRPNMEMGTALRENEHYTLVVEEGWQDVHGNVLKEAFRKSFTCSSADRKMPNEEDWEIITPVSSSAPLLIELKETLDGILLPESLIVMDSRGHKVPGKIQLLNNESTVSFTADVDWKNDEYVLYINPLLEDLAGNNLNRLFDTDISEPAARQERTVVSRNFTVDILQN